MLDTKGNRNKGWGVNEKRGGLPYEPPLGWIGFGINVLDKYDNGNNDWLAYNGNPNEWAIAYHGIGNGRSESEVKKFVNLIVTSNTLKKGQRQRHSDCPNINKKITGDEFVGEGAYCTPSPKIMYDYAGSCGGYKMAVMLRVNPKRIRFCKCYQKKYWVLNGSTDEIRPYRILIKKV